MSEVLQIASISAPGFFGLNTQDSPLDLASGFALVATNCVIDQYGRIGSRKGWSKVNSSSGNLGANTVGVIHELVQADGTLTVLFAGNNKLFFLNGSNAVVELTYGGWICSYDYCRQLVLCVPKRDHLLFPNGP